MKILSTLGISAAAIGLAASTNTIKAKQIIPPSKQDTFERIASVTPHGTENDSVLLFAPNPEIIIEGQLKTAAFVVDLSKNILYHYDEEGNARNAYMIASGKKTSPTHTGVRVVTHVETYPYRTAPSFTKRRKHPWNYGPKIICLAKLDTETGERSQTGEFIHGNNDSSSIGKYASMGCMRMDNDVILQLASEVKRGDIVIIQRNGQYEKHL